MGTGSGVTSLKRYHSSFMLTSGSYSLLIDSGDGVSRALIQSGIGFNEINSIVISHFHPDHLNGISSLLIQMKMNKRSNKLNIYIHNELQDLFLKFLEINYIFKLRLGFDLEIHTFNHNEYCVINEEFGFTSKGNSHLIKLSDYVKPGDRNLISCSFIFNAGNKKIYYSGDLGSKDDLYLFDSAQIDYMISEATHIELPDLYKAYKKFNPSKLFITHISDDKEQQLNMWYNELSESEGQSIIATNDGLTAEL